MHLYELPLLFALVGLALYTVLAGADFGAGIWQIAPGRRGEDAAHIREHAHEAMAPVWEANHVWLIFVLTVIWTAYPTAFGSLASTLSVALFIAGLGIIVRGAAYALRAGTTSPREQRLVDAASGVSSVLTPFALAAAVGGIASRRVPVGNAAGHLFTSWLNPTSILVGVLAVVSAAYVAAVFLAADAVRLDRPELARAFRARALGTGVISGAIALGGIAVVHGDAHPLYRGLVEGDGIVALVVSVVGGAVTLALVWRSRFEPARYTAGLAVAAIIAGWALAQKPVFLPGLTVRAAAAGHDTLVAVVVAIVAGGVILAPSLLLLFRLTLGGRLGSGATAQESAERPTAAALSASLPGLLARAAAASLLVGVGMLNVAEARWAHAVGVIALFAFIVLALLGLLASAAAGAAAGEGDEAAAPGG